ncbi:hypothetical protein C8R44DRAFT_747835 [Mycena epipterygia]|nr:hypothetical protein C8R44DRAFT_747835 [Mycena epipterygia]
MAWWIRVSMKQLTNQKSMPLLPRQRGNVRKNVFARLKAWWIRTRNICPHCLGGEEMPTKVMILDQFGHGYYIHGTLKRLMGVLAWLMAWWIRVFWLASELGGSVWV